MTPLQSSILTRLMSTIPDASTFEFNRSTLEWAPRYAQYNHDNVSFYWTDHVYRVSGYISSQGSFGALWVAGKGDVIPFPLYKCAAALSPIAHSRMNENVGKEPGANLNDVLSWKLWEKEEG